MTDEQLMEDAYEFARNLAAKVAAEKGMLLDQNTADALAWSTSMVLELGRTIVIGIMAAYERPNPNMYKLFMNQLAMQATLFGAHPGVIEETMQRARAAAAKIDEMGTSKH